MQSARTSSKTKKRRSASTGDLGTASDSTLNGRQSSVSRRQSAPADLLATPPDQDSPPSGPDTTPNTAPDTGNLPDTDILRSRSASEGDLVRQRRIDLQRSQSTSDLNPVVRRDSELRRDGDPNSAIDPPRNAPRPIQRRRSLSDLSTAIDPDTTIPDLRPARFRSRSVGADSSAFSQKRFDETSLTALLDSLEQTDVDALPWVRTLSLNDSSKDADDAEFVADTAKDVGLEIAVRRSSYSLEEGNAIPLSPEVDQTLTTLQAELTRADDLSGSEPYLTDLLPNLRTQDKQAVSSELLNDVYYLAREKLSKPLITRSLTMIHCLISKPHGSKD
ncbi:MAG: hypothetical protein HC781_03375 [Leptolyngbyaceae cyanobacterium CSU_1_4]|nr:hypothetical protein [Leptolyngbyaceae cyanobacterium CSU_1_4]